MDRLMTREHQWVEMKVTPVTVIVLLGKPHIISTGKEPQITVGCFACNMGLSEGLTCECPGQDLFDEGGDQDVD